MKTMQARMKNPAAINVFNRLNVTTKQVARSNPWSGR
jgi:hypothetical protein